MSKDRIGFSYNSSIPSRAIRWITGSKTSHAFILYYDEDFKDDFVLEATEPEIHILPWKAFKQENTIVAVYTPKYPIDKGFVGMGDWVGRKYNLLGLIGMLWVLFWRHFGIEVKNPLTSKKAMFCSETISKILENSNYPGWAWGHIDTKDPELLRVFCENNMDRWYESYTDWYNQN